jgi:uncharacterized protein involved in exopolysaccharide biosynthesis
MVSGGRIARGFEIQHTLRHSGYFHHQILSRESEMSHVDVRFYLTIFMRRLPLFVITATLVTLLGYEAAQVLPPVYRAEAQFLVEPPQIPAELARSTAPVDMSDQLRLIELQMMSRANLLALAQRLKLYAHMPNITDEDIADDIRSRTTIERIRFDPNRASDRAAALAVSFKARNPEIAAAVANEFVKLIIERNARLRTDQAVDTLKFFQLEVTKLSYKLSELEGQILKFKNANKDSLPDSLPFRRNQQVALQERLVQLDREEASLRERRSRLVQAVEGTGRLPDASLASPEEQTLAQLRRTLAEQETVFAPTSPTIVALKAQIASLEGRIKAGRAKGSEAEPGKKQPTELDFQLADVDGRLATLAQDKTTIGKDLAALTATIAATPEVELTLASLERDYQNVQGQFSVANAKLGEASTGQQLEQRAKGQRLTILEAATPPDRPIGPKRRAIMLGGLAGGIALGLGFIVLFELFNDRIRRPAELLQKLRIEPLVTIPYIETKEEVRARRFVAIPAMIALLVLGPATLLTLRYFQPSINKTFEDVMGDIKLPGKLPN